MPCAVFLRSSRYSTFRPASYLFAGQLELWHILLAVSFVSFMVFRHIGHGMPVAVVQFTKSEKWDTGEARLLAKFPELVTLHIMGEGFTWETQDRARDIAAARAGWEQAKALIRDDRHQLVLLDELNIVLRYDYLPLDEVLTFLREEKPADKHVVITGRNAHDSLIEMADLVTDMTMVKHPFRQGVKAQKGIEF